MQIKVDFQDTINKAKELEDYSDKIKRVSQDLNSISDSLLCGWKGAASERYIKKMNQVSSKINCRAKSLKKNAEGIEKSAKRLKKIDELGATLFGKH